MAAEEKTEEGATEAAAPAAGGGGKLAMIISLVNLVATLGVIGVVMISHQKNASKPTVEDIVAGQAKGHGGDKGGHGGGGGHGEPAKAEEAITDSGKIIALEPFTVNLSTSVGTHPRYARMNVSVELEQGVPDQEFNVKLPRIRDTIINLINSKKATEINTVDGRDLLKDEVKKSLNGFMVQSKVRGIYFTNFAISN